MSAPDTTPSRFGSINSGQDGTFANDFALFLKVFAGEILTAFNDANKIMPRHTVRTINSGKTAQFPCSGKATAAYHTPGSTLLGTNAIKHNERTINIDGWLISDTFVANIDEAMSHYDVRGEYATKLGLALATQADKQLLQVGVLSARAAANVTGGNGGTVLTDASFSTDGEALYNGLFDAQQAMDEKDVPDVDRYCALRPAQYKLLARYTKIHNKDWGGGGSIQDGIVAPIAGFEIVKTNNLPITNISVASPAPNNTYHADFSTTKGLCWQREAMGTVKLRDLAMETEYSASRQGTLMLAKMAVGHNYLRPECAVEMKTA